MELSGEERLARWGPGPWLEEPARIEWRFEGTPCLMFRNPLMGHWCGYVGVAPGHPWHGQSYDELGDVEAHGGITYAQACGGEICHAPEAGEPEDIWWVGFDCAHWGDLSPGMRGHDAGYRELLTYRDRHYVAAAVEGLARQAADAQAQAD